MTARPRSEDVADQREPRRREPRRSLLPREQRRLVAAEADPHVSKRRPNRPTKRTRKRRKTKKINSLDPSFDAATFSSADPLIPFPFHTHTPPHLTEKTISFIQTCSRTTPADLR